MNGLKKIVGGSRKMEIKYNILPIMVKDHYKIHGLLNDFEEKTKQNHGELLKSFYTFEWELEKHLFIEEKAIFTLYSPEDITEGYKMLPELTKQHNKILNMLNNLRQDVLHKRPILDIYEFKEFLTKHKNFEEQEVYPRLDKTLDPSQKEFIVHRINEVISK
jgi:hemerythrin-like domain-containing protein